MTFGDDTKPVDEYVKPKLNYSEQWDKLFGCQDIDEGMIIPFMRRLSTFKGNVQNMQLANMYFFTIPKSVVRHFIVLQKNHGFKFMKSLKKEKSDDKLQFLYDAVCRYYNWSMREFELHKEFIDLMDPDLHTMLHHKYGFEKKECKILGITDEKIKVKFTEVPRQKGWF